MEDRAEEAATRLIEAFRGYRGTLYPKSISEMVDEDLIRSILKSFQDHQDGMTLMHQVGEQHANGTLETLYPKDHDPENRQFAQKYNPFCKRFRELSEAHNEMCLKCDRERAELVLKGTERDAEYRCHMHLNEVTHAIRFAGKKRGVLFAGQRVIKGDDEQVAKINQQIDGKVDDSAVRKELKALISEDCTEQSAWSELVKRFHQIGSTLEDTIQTIHNARQREALQHAVNEVHQFLDSQCSPVDGGWEEPIEQVVYALAEHACEAPIWLLARKESRFRVVAASELRAADRNTTIATRLLFPIDDDKFIHPAVATPVYSAIKAITGMDSITLFRVASPPVSTYPLSIVLLIGDRLSEELEELVAGCARALAVPVNYATLYLRLEDQKRRYLTEVSNTGHHLKTPIQSALFAIRRLEAEDEIAVEERQDIAKGASMDLLMACGEALQLQTANLDHLVKVDLYALMEEIVSGVGINLGREYGVSLEFPNRPAIDLRIKGSREHLRIIFLALIDNALKYSFKDRVVNVRFDRRRRPHQRRSQAVVDVEIENYGIGFDPAMKDALFEEGGRANVEDENRKRVGVGLGLPMAKQLIEDQDGSIDIESEQVARLGAGEGAPPHLTTVIVTLPAFQQN